MTIEVATCPECGSMTTDLDAEGTTCRNCGRGVFEVRRGEDASVVVSACSPRLGGTLTADDGLCQTDFNRWARGERFYPGARNPDER